MKETKQQLRCQLKAQTRKELTSVRRLEWSESICKSIASHPKFQSARRVALYCALPDEPDLKSILENYALTKELLVPRVEGIDISFYRYNADQLQESADYHIAEPMGAPSEAVSPDDIDLILVPGLAFDSQGGRLGRGKGFYDRFLTECSAWRIGISYRFRLIDQVPCDPWDLLMNEVITD